MSFHSSFLGVVSIRSRGGVGGSREEDETRNGFNELGERTLTATLLVRLCMRR